MVVIGNAGADFNNIRGYVTAYDLQTGAQKWRFFTVPRDPKLGPQDQPHLVEAAKTWDPRHRWEAGGGATVWDGIAYDPQLQLVYVGTANGSPYNIKEGGREGGDGLLFRSIIAIHAQSGELAWYLQPCPGSLGLRQHAEDDPHRSERGRSHAQGADAGRQERLLLRARPRERRADFREAVCLRQLDAGGWIKKPARPTPNPDADYNRGASLVFPSMAGAHSWFPMAYNPGTGLVYIPTLETPMVFFDFGKSPLH